MEAVGTGTEVLFRLSLESAAARRGLESTIRGCRHLHVSNAISQLSDDGVRCYHCLWSTDKSLACSAVRGEHSSIGPSDVRLRPNSDGGNDAIKTSAEHDRGRGRVAASRDERSG